MMQLRGDLSHNFNMTTDEAMLLANALAVVAAGENTADQLPSQLNFQLQTNYV
jgi:hypothetical protein